MEFMPITTSGKDHLLYPFTSIIQLNAARNRKQIPPLNNVQLGVQIRLTIGQIAVKCRRRPEARPIAPAIRSGFIGMRGAETRIQRPAARPRIIVPSVGIKLSVKYPPPFATNGFTRGSRLRNHWSNAFPRLPFLFQWAAKPT